jgi:hypothetical protein
MPIPSRQSVVETFTRVLARVLSGAPTEGAWFRGHSRGALQALSDRIYNPVSERS